MIRDVFEIQYPGPMTTIQDMGRFGFRKYGIPVSGALDRFSSSVANRLVGNPMHAPLLETTFLGPRMLALSDCVISLTGASVNLKINQREKPLWSTLKVRAGDVVSVGPAKSGVRSYLAIGGGVWSPTVMGSSSTLVAAGLGGFQGRNLQEGDRIQAGFQEEVPPMLALDDKFIPCFDHQVILRSVQGPQADYFDEGLQTFVSSVYVTTPGADRMGVRLHGPPMEFRSQSKRTIVSEPSLPGCVQAPPDGQPIILLVEQTIGGYAKIATVISADLDLVAQLRPGDQVNFVIVSLAQARTARMDSELGRQSIKFHVS